mmetsp:Transcript_77196/g.151193  ORF Transcript_77196/g.151193 Transcript_77196/m.151193 type:complete len:151 (+) Transcript_77196:256-708(+)
MIAKWVIWLYHGGTQMADTNKGPFIVRSGRKRGSLNHERRISAKVHADAGTGFWPHLSAPIGVHVADHTRQTRHPIHNFNPGLYPMFRIKLNGQAGLVKLTLRVKRKIRLNSRYNITWHRRKEARPVILPTITVMVKRLKDVMLEELLAP